MNIFDGCYDAGRAASLSGVPVSTVYHWARSGLIEPSISSERTKLWSYADLMALRIIYWVRHPKDEVPASPMAEVRRALEQLASLGLDLWRGDRDDDASPLIVTRDGKLHVRAATYTMTSFGQGLLDGDQLDVLGPFDTESRQGPDLRRPRPHLRIIPGKLSGEPHLVSSRLTTQAVASLASRGFTVADISRLYPDESPEGLAEAVDLELQLAA